MPELTQVSDDVYVLLDFLNYGIIKIGDGNCALIDTGLDEQDAQTILDACKIMNQKPAAIINTHSHADHYGGNHHIEKSTNCSVYAPELEAAIMANPELEPLYIYGAYTPSELRQSSVMGTKSVASDLLQEPSVTIGNKTFDVVSLKGHSPNQMGVVVEDVFFCGDSVFSKPAWERFVIIYMADVGNTVKTLERLLKVGAKAYIPSHVAPIADDGEFADIVNYNIIRIQMIADEILHILKKPANAPSILDAICKAHNLHMKTIQQYYFSLDTIKAYLSYLYEQNLITYQLDCGMLYWQA
jgi:glyoxylase-like metal-dependent hydrolase (beta-lactamase superfamily II)